MSQPRALDRDRQQINKYLGAISKQLENLDEQLAELDPSTTQVIRRLLGGRLAELLSHRGFAELLDEPMSYDISSHVLTSREATARAGPARAIETELESYRANVSARSAPDLLKRLLRALRQPVQHFLEIERGNRGGAPPQYLPQSRDCPARPGLRASLAQGPGFDAGGQVCIALRTRAWSYRPGHRGSRHGRRPDP